MQKRVLPAIGRCCLIVLIGLCSGVRTLPAQGTDVPGDSSSSLADQDAGLDILKNFSLILFPKVFADAWELREYVRGDAFARVRRVQGDGAAVDALFAYARELSWHNNAEALLISLAASLDHRRVGVLIPPFNFALWFPLTSEFPEEFESRVSALPRKLYADSPNTPGGDRDKLQHFFGSAFLAYVFESRESADRVGDFVEWGEERFVVNGTYDPRDLRANWQGQQFGLRLLDDPRARPSHFLHLVLALKARPSPEEQLREWEEFTSDVPEVR
jgi:hypothetical protein